jgi:hypoxanthine phosphoribosyltransferase
MKTIKIHNQTFIKYIGKADIQKAVRRIADQIEKEYTDDVPLFVVVLNGAMFFAVDLMQQLNIPIEVCSVKYSSYTGMQSSGNITQLIGISKDISNRRVIVVEDIVDTGLTIKHIYEQMLEKKARDIKIVSLAFKKEVYKEHIPIDYIGFEVEDKFIVGYGLDYNELGRNLPCIYQLKI